MDSLKPQSQRLLFPQTITLNASDTELLTEMLPELRTMGFEVESFGQNTFVVNAMPIEAQKQDVKDTIDHLLEALQEEYDGCQSWKRKIIWHAHSPEILPRAVCAI